MKKYLLVIFVLLAIVACDKANDANQPEQPSGKEEPKDFSIALSYDSVANTVTAIPSDSTGEYVLTVWMVDDYILDYGDDFSDAHVKESLQSYLDLCIDYGMAFPTFVGSQTLQVYEFFDQPYPGEDFIAMAAEFDVKTKKVQGSVFKIFFTTPCLSSTVFCSLHCMPLLSMT